MPHTAQNPASAGPEAPPKAAPPSGPPKPEPPDSGNTPPKPGAKGALFRALLDAGADAMVAYTASEETQSMVSESVVAHVQPMLMEMRQLFRENRQALAENRQALAAQERRLDSLAADVRGLKEIVNVKTDALKVEIRLVWGALGVLVTVLIAVFGFWFTN